MAISSATATARSAISATLALEKAPAGSQLPAATEEGITLREIAEAIGRRLQIPTLSIPPEQAADHLVAEADGMVWIGDGGHRGYAPDEVGERLGRT